MSRTTDDPSMRTECRRKAAWHLLTSGRIEPGLAELRRLLADIGSTFPRTPRGAVLGLVWHRACLRMRGSSLSIRHASEIPERDLRELDVLSTVGRGLALIDNVRGAYFQARALRRALALGEPNRLIPALALEAIFHSTQGGRSLARAEALIARVDGLAERHGDPYALGWRDAAAGTTAYFAGRFPESAEHLGNAITRFRDHAVGATWELNTARMFRLFALRQGGELAHAHRLYEEYIRDAVRRGDRYVEASMRRYCTVLLLARDRPEAARDNLARAHWPVPDGQYHVQHWWELEALGEVAIYEGRAAEALEELAERITALERSLLTRVQSIRALFGSLRARMHLSAAAAGHDRDTNLTQAERIAQRMRKEKVAYAATWAETVLAGIAHQRGDRSAALTHLRTAESLARQHHINLTIAAARYRRGVLLEGPERDALIADGEQRMRAQGVRTPARFSRMIAPGF